jgi:Domain of unknown function (DUF4440)
MKAAISLVLLTLGLSFYSGLVAQTPDENKKLMAELAELSQKIYEAGLSGDQKFLCKHIADDFSENDDSGDFRGEYRSVLYDVTSVEKFSHDVVDARIQRRGDVAVLSYRWVISFDREGQKIIRQLGVTDVYHQRDGVWQLLSTHRDFAGRDFPAVSGKAQRPTGDRLEKIVAFLARGKEVGLAKATFTGEFVPIPAPLVKKLETWLFLHHFYVVRMKRSFDISSTMSNLLVVVDELSNEVAGWVWDFSIDDMHGTFNNILAMYPPEGEEKYQALRVKAIGDLLLSLDEENERSVGKRVGSIVWNSRGVSADLIYDYGPAYTLSVDVSQGRFGKLSLIRRSAN